jgi:hypothetical protein
MGPLRRTGRTCRHAGLWHSLGEMRPQSESSPLEGLAGESPTELDVSTSQGAPPWEGCQGLRPAGLPGAGTTSV